ncbi:MAG: glutamate formimidoyltransferase [Bacteroidales bacterium]|nr:glutamate formimidoyltransferase [Bacteroidales bacterium]
MERIIECVPNFSEGRDKEIIASIAEAIASAGPKVLNIDPGEAANRTVITFAGTPEDVCEGAFRGVMKAAELIDMRKHHGTHPRSGATDVLPLVPVSGVSLEECAEMARTLAKRIYDELGIACYCYEAAAFRPEFRNLAVCRAGEYEALPEKLADPQRRPDFGPETMTPAIEKSGAINVGARNYLIAVNFNLDTESTKLANAIAFDVREKGRIAPDGTRVPGTLKGCKALGWFIEEYGIAQVSMNITDIDATPLHRAFEEVSRAAEARGVHVTGTEIIGLVPERVLLEAGRYFLGGDASDEDLIDAAIEAMGLSDLRPFVPSEKILEHRIKP